jgi:hypothetical protein
MQESSWVSHSSEDDDEGDVAENDDEVLRREGRLLPRLDSLDSDDY